MSLDSDSLSVCSNSQSIPNVSGDSSEGFNSISKLIERKKCIMNLLVNFNYYYEYYIKYTFSD